MSPIGDNAVEKCSTIPAENARSMPAVTTYKLARTRLRRWPLHEASLKPYWGKPTVRNFRRGGGNEVDGLMAFCHETRKGGYIGSHWPNHVRASALLDSGRVRSWLVGTVSVTCPDLRRQF